MADKVHISREAPGPASESSAVPSGEGSSHQFGLTAAIALIVGSIIGVGALCPRHDCRRTVAGVLDLVHRVFAQHGTQLLGLLGAILPGRRRVTAQHPRLPGTAPSYEPAGVRAALP